MSTPSARSRLERTKDDDVDRLTGGDRRVGRDDGEPVGEHHGAEDRRALVTREASAVAVQVGRQGDPQVSTPRPGVLDRLERPRPQPWAVDRMGARHPAYRRSHEY